jgi:hypothetical protein
MVYCCVKKQAQGIHVRRQKHDLILYDFRQVFPRFWEILMKSSMLLFLTKKLISNFIAWIMGSEGL